MSAQSHGNLNRRQFLAGSAVMIVGATSAVSAQEAAEPIIDIHQHTNYTNRSNEQLFAHQKRMGVTHTILLPAGTPVNRDSTHKGRSNGLAALCGGVDTVTPIVRDRPREYFYFANEVTDLPEARERIEAHLKQGALGIGEQKFSLDVESDATRMICELAQAYSVPVLLHFQHEMYNLGFDRFYKVLEKYPKVNFIGHAQTWWANIDKHHADQKVLYPKGKVTPGGLTDKYLSDYPNIFGDMSAGSGLNSMTRDEDHARGFLDRHRDKLLYGSDCNDRDGHGETCQGAQILAAIRKLAPNKAIERKILFENSRTLFKMNV
jgi:predicted TIM-barrel fold metal-dependent hydrolase